MEKPTEFNAPTFGIAKVLTKGKEEYLFLHPAAYTTKREADNIEELGKKLIEIAQYLRKT